MVQEYRYALCSSGKSAKLEPEEELQLEVQKLKLKLQMLESEGDGITSLIFGCTEDNYDECILKNLFGFSVTLLPLVQLVKPSMPVFLFNFQSRMMFGLFEAVSEGMMNIDPHAWTDTFSTSSGVQTDFPAQVRVKLVSERIIKLEEEIFGESITRNYFMPGRFYFHLDRHQTDSLIQKFNSSLHSRYLNLPLDLNRHDRQMCETGPPVQVCTRCTTLKPQTVVSDVTGEPETLPDSRHMNEHLLQTCHVLPLRCNIISEP